MFVCLFLQTLKDLTLNVLTQLSAPSFPSNRPLYRISAPHFLARPYWLSFGCICSYHMAHGLRRQASLFASFQQHQWHKPMWLLLSTSGQVFADLSFRKPVTGSNKQTNKLLSRSLQLELRYDLLDNSHKCDTEKAVRKIFIKNSQSNCDKVWHALKTDTFLSWIRKEGSWWTVWLAWVWQQLWADLSLSSVALYLSLSNSSLSLSLSVGLGDYPVISCNRSPDYILSHQEASGRLVWQCFSKGPPFPPPHGPMYY